MTATTLPNRAVHRRETRLTVDREYACPDHLPTTVSAMSPLFFWGWMHFTLRNVTAGGATLRTVTDGACLLPHLELVFTVTVPFTGTHEVHAVVRSIHHESDGAVAVWVSWIDPPRAFLTASRST